MVAESLAESHSLVSPSHPAPSQLQLEIHGIWQSAASPTPGNRVSPTVSPKQDRMARMTGSRDSLKTPRVATAEGRQHYEAALSSHRRVDPTPYSTFRSCFRPAISSAIKNALSLTKNSSHNHVNTLQLNNDDTPTRDITARSSQRDEDPMTAKRMHAQTADDQLIEELRLQKRVMSAHDVAEAISKSQFLNQTCE